MSKYQVYRGDPEYVALLTGKEVSRDSQRAGFETLYREQIGPIRRTLKKVFRDQCDEGVLDDLGHDIVLKVRSALDRGVYLPGGNFNGFVYRIAKNAAINHLRDNGRRLDVLQTRVAHEPIFFDETLDRIILELDAVLLRQILSELPVIHKQILKLYFFDDLLYENIAESLGIPFGTVASRLYRAKNAFGDLLKAKGLFEDLAA